MMKNITKYLNEAIQHPTDLNREATVVSNALNHASEINQPNIEVAEGTEAIGNEYYNACRKIQTVKLPNSLKEIGDGAFGNCNKLTSINIPNNVTYIGEYAFGSCNNLQHVYYLGTSQPTIATNIFEGSSKITEIKVKDEYKEIIQFNTMTITPMTSETSGEVNYFVDETSGLMVFYGEGGMEDKNVYDEYLYANNAWELVGSTAVDLSNYYTKTQTDTLLANKAEIVEITQAEYDALPTASKNNGSIYSITDAVVVDPANYYTKTQADAAFNPKNTTTANSGSYKFPNWNANG